MNIPATPTSELEPLSRRSDAASRGEITVVVIGVLVGSTLSTFALYIGLSLDSSCFAIGPVLSASVLMFEWRRRNGSRRCLFLRGSGREPVVRSDRHSANTELA